MLEDVDHSLRVLRMDDERRQHVLVWLDEAMHGGNRLDQLRRVRDLGRYFVRMGLRDEGTRKRRALIRTLHEGTYARSRGTGTTRRGLTERETEDLVLLIRERTANNGEFAAILFVGVVFEGKSYEAMAAELAPKFGAASPEVMRASVSRTRGELRVSLAWYLKIGPSDFITESRGGLS